jgi:hypothetical protein
MSMTAFPGTMDKPRFFAPRNIRRSQFVLAVLILVGLVSFASVRAFETDDQRDCGPFTIGKSAIGGCDGIGR